MASGPSAGYKVFEGRQSGNPGRDHGFRPQKFGPPQLSTHTKNRKKKNRKRNFFEFTRRTKERGKGAISKSSPSMTSPCRDQCLTVALATRCMPLPGTGTSTVRFYQPRQRKIKVTSVFAIARPFRWKSSASTSPTGIMGRGIFRAKAKASAHLTRRRQALGWFPPSRRTAPTHHRVRVNHDKLTKDQTRGSRTVSCSEESHHQLPRAGSPVLNDTSASKPASCPQIQRLDRCDQPPSTPCTRPLSAAGGPAMSMIRAPRRRRQGDAACCWAELQASSDGVAISVPTRNVSGDRSQDRGVASRTDVKEINEAMKLLFPSMAAQCILVYNHRLAELSIDFNH